MKENPVKRALRAGKPQFGTWLTLGSVAAARFMARVGLPWLTVDMEHTHTDIQTASYMFAAIADAGCVPLARIPTGKHEYIKMVLDSGAMGIVAPMVMDADEARAIVAACKYPPRGNRSIGGGMHAINFGTTSDEYYRRADDEILVIIQTEHIDAVNIADEIYSVPGIDAIFVGPNDLTYSMRSADGTVPRQGDVRGHADPDPRGAPAQPRPLRAARVLAGRCPPPGPRGLAVHRRQQRAEDDARGRRRPHQEGPRRSPSPGPGEVLIGTRIRATSIPDERPDPLDAAPDDRGGVLRPELVVEQLERQRPAIADRAQVGDHARADRRCRRRPSPGPRPSGSGDRAAPAGR